MKHISKSQKQDSKEIKGSEDSFLLLGGSLKDEMLKDREILINEEITEKLIETVVMQIEKFNQEDDDAEMEKVGYKREEHPIVLYLNTFGGNVYECFSIISAIQSSSTPIFTCALGKAMSCGFMILCAGHRRFCQKYSTLMYHQISGGAMGKLNEIIENVEHMAQLQQIGDDLVLSSTSIDADKLKIVNERKTDWYMFAEEALKLGVVDEII